MFSNSKGMTCLPYPLDSTPIMVSVESNIFLLPLPPSIETNVRSQPLRAQLWSPDFHYFSEETYSKKNLNK